MRQDIDETAIARQETRGQEGETRVFHPAVGEAGREEEDVVSSPYVRISRDAFRCGQEGFSIRKFPRRLVQDFRFAPNPGTRSNLTRCQVSRSDGNQIGGDRGSLCEFEGAGEAVGLFHWPRKFIGAHDDSQIPWQCNFRRISCLNAGSILTGQKGTSVDSLALGEQVGMDFTDSLCWVEPLGGAAALCSFIVDAKDFDGVKGPGGKETGDMEAEGVTE